MYSAKDFLLDQGELLSRGELSLAGEAGEARQVIDIALGPAHPVRGVDVPPAARAARAVPPEIIKFAEDIFIFDVAAGVPSQGSSANAT